MIHVYTVRNLYPCRSVVNCSSEMVLSIRYSTIKKKEAAVLNIPQYVQLLLFQYYFIYRGNSVLFFTFPTILPRKLILSTMENTTEQVNWYFSSAVVSSWKGLSFIIHVRVFFHDIAWNIFLKGLICLTLIFICNV